LVEYHTRRVGEKDLVVGIVREPSKLLRKSVDGREVAAHALDESLAGHARVARQRGVADEVGALEAFGERGMAGERSAAVQRAREHHRASRGQHRTHRTS
jgi:hypothetical protein